MKVVWSLLAIEDREAIFTYVEADNQRMATTLLKAEWMRWQTFRKAAE